MPRRSQHIKGREPVITVKEIDALKSKGWTQTQIAQEYGVTRQYISWIKKQYNGKRTPREKALDNYPWDVPAEFSTAHLYRLTRNHAEYMVTGGKGMNENELQRLRGFYTRIKDYNLVVEFDPEIPPNRDSKVGGWAYRDRRKSDKDLIIRKNKHTKLTDEGRMLWRLPEVLP